MNKSLLNDALDQIPDNGPDSVETLLTHLSAHISNEDAHFFDPGLLVDMAKTHWDLAKERTGSEAKIRVYCPLTTTERKCRKTVIDIVSDDMAFLVDSVVAAINKHNLLIDFLLHPLFYVQYNDKGALSHISEKYKDNFIRQSHIHVHIRDTVAVDVLSELEKDLARVLKHVRFSNNDWKAMLSRLQEAREELAIASTKDSSPEEIERYGDFLDYLHNNNLTLLGYREHKYVTSKGKRVLKPVKGSGLGLLRETLKPSYINDRDAGLADNLLDIREKLPAVFISKTITLATVHRNVPMDAITIKTYDKKGNITGEKLFLGLFTSVTYSRSVADVPYLREKVEKVMTLSKQLPGSHDYKALRHILEKYPRDELFQISPKDLLNTCLSILRLQERQNIALYMRKDPYGRYISCLVYIPRDRFGTELRKKICTVLEEELAGECTSFHINLDDSVFARVMYLINIEEPNSKIPDHSYLESLLRSAGQSWSEHLSEALNQYQDDDERTTMLTLKYGEAFPVDYTSRYSGRRAISDIEKTEDVLEDNRLHLDLYRPPTVEKSQLRLKVYNPGVPLTLSDVMPILAHMNMRAISELPFEVTPKDCEKSIWIHDFLLEIPENLETINLEQVKPIFEDAFGQIWYGHVESDPLNRLVLSAGLTWREIIILRTYVRYMKQIRYPFSQSFVERSLTNNPKISCLLADLFQTYHDPAQQKSVEARVKAMSNDIVKALEAVRSLEEDRVLRSILGLIKATLRTNYYQRDEHDKHKPYLSIKIDCHAVAELPEPKPYREIFVYSPKVEGTHLRGDKIARGGIRWSDRHEDFRTEVLGLMKAQMVKNSVIVPMGAKGGFVVKRPPQSGDRQAFLDEGIACYKTLVRGLLDITDNRSGNKVIPPKNVVRRDDDDPYLVVAADKGTATFSDIANGLSGEYGFWLGDAFASGGSAGYDHKKMGITARGAWESVKLHFRHLNHNIQEQPFDVIGVGDMGGDVFGNGMLLSEQIRLVGAFNHLHIFCDPDPDPASTFKERKRLFKGAMGWDQYDTKKLSKGGRIYSRDDKTLVLTPEIQARFDIDKKEVSPIELMHAILKARTDLLWFGGIGTYIKSSSETHQDVGDKANDSIRLDANEVRAKVIGEGANLGVTQSGRIQFSQNGGHINTDFIDNSGGVDSSDHEVNIKILLTDVMSNKNHKLDLKARNKLLEDMTDDVAQKVLFNNYQQAQAISLTEYHAPKKLQEHEEFIQYLERKKGLKRKLEGLPDSEEIAARMKLGKGLTRPELSILVSHAKIDFTQKLMGSDVPDQEYMQGWVMRYFPDVLRERYKTEILRHRLKREIISTRIASSIVNRMGPSFVKELQEKTNEDDASIVKSYILTLEIFHLRKIWNAIEGMDNKVPATVQLRAMSKVTGLTEHVMTWLLTTYKGVTFTTDDLEKYINAVDALRKDWSKLVSNDQRKTIKALADKWINDGLPKDLAMQMACIPSLASACDIARISLAYKKNLFDTAAAYFELGHLFELEWLRKKAKYISTQNHWQDEAKSVLINGLFDLQATLTVKVLTETKGKKLSAKQSIVDKWKDDNEHALKSFPILFNKLRDEGSLDFAMLMIAEQHIRGLCHV